jgi:hypothetical protein
VLDLTDPTLQMSDHAIKSFVDTAERVRLLQRPDTVVFHRRHSTSINAIDPNTARSLYVTLCHARTTDTTLSQLLNRRVV